jgi:hypothetical protein
MFLMDFIILDKKSENLEIVIIMGKIIRNLFSAKNRVPPQVS